MEGFVGILIIFAVIGIVSFVLGISARTAVLFLAFIGAFIGNPFNISFDITRGYAWAWGLGALASYLIERYSEPEEEESVRRIKHLQEFLNIKEDGVFGDKTKKAVEKFQSENNLEITGKTDTATLEAMNKEIDEKST